MLDPATGLTQVLADGTNTYLYGNARLGQYQTAMQYFGADGLGSVRQIFDASAQVVGSSRYDPFGNVMARSGATSVFAFAGEQYDAATGLEYLRARYYSSAQGRFTTRDVWEGDPNAPMSYNAWIYTSGNPINLTDPTGQCDPSECPDLWKNYLYRHWAPWYFPATPIPTATCTATPAPKEGTIYLTIDDGPGGYTTQVLNALNDNRVKATFFLIGQQIKGNEDQVMRMKREGHAIGVHSFEHKTPVEEWGTMGKIGQEQSIQKTQNEIQRVTGYKSDLFRAPGGGMVQDQKTGAWVSNTTADLTGLYNYNWTIDSHDWNTPGVENAQLVSNNVTTDPRLRNGSIILIHSVKPVDEPALRIMLPILTKRFNFGLLERPVEFKDPLGNKKPISWTDPPK